MELDIWNILQITPDASKREIRRAYATQAQKYHPEEQPEEFARLQEAYQLALQYHEQSTFENREENTQPGLEVSTGSLQTEDMSAETSVEMPDNSLLATMENAYAAEMERRQGEGVLKEMIILFEDPKASKGNKAWSEFFQSDSFLQVYFEESLAESLDYYLEHQNIYPHEELPQGFLVEWAIAYAMITEADGCMYQDGDIPMRKVIAKHWNQQTEMWRLQRGARMLVRIENRVRIQAYYDYIVLRMMEKQGLLTIENENRWREILWHGKPQRIYEVSKGRYGDAASIILLRLFAYWISKEEAPLDFAKKIYEEYELKGNERSSSYSVYKELKEAILQRFPDIEEVDEVHESIKRWVYELIRIESEFMEQACYCFLPETKDQTEEIQKLFAREEWEKYKYHSQMKQALLHSTYFYNIPITIAEALYHAYSVEDDAEDPKKNELKEHAMSAIINYKKAVGTDELVFWEYFFMYGFGICSKEVHDEELDVEGINNVSDKYVRSNRLYLPAYIKTEYKVSGESVKEFVGYDEETGKIGTPKFYAFTLPDADVIKAEYHIHFIAYYRNGERIYQPFLSYECFENYEKKITKAEDFFFLLAQTKIKEENRLAARELVMKWLSETGLAETTFSVIADCVVSNDAEDRDTPYCDILENASICLFAKETPEGVQLYEHTELGLIPMELRAGKDWSDCDRKRILEAHIKPNSVRIASFQTKGLTQEEKVSILLDGLMLYAKHEKGLALTAPVLPKEYPELVSLFEGGMGWLVDNFVVLYRRLSENNIRKEVLHISVGDNRCYQVYSEYSHPEREWRKIEDLQHKVKRMKYENCILSGRIIRDDCINRSFSKIYPFVLGKSGKMYFNYNMARLGETESVFEMLSKLLDLKNVVQCDVFEGKMLVSKKTGQLECGFSKEDFLEAQNGLRQDWEKAYAYMEEHAELDDMLEQEDEESEEEGETYRRYLLNQTTAAYLNDMDKEEYYKDRCETLAEYYCIL